MTNYKNFLLAMGIAVSSIDTAEARDNALLDDIEQVASLSSQLQPSSLFLEIDAKQDTDEPNWNVSCVNNNSCNGTM